VYGFEGGQMPLYMRLPKRGFNNIFALDFAEVGLGRIQKAIDGKRLDGSSKITEDMLRSAGLARGSRHGIRLLGGALKAKIDIEVAGATSSAAGQIRNAGGSVKLTFKKPVRTNKKGEPGKKAQRRAKSAEKRAARTG
jgi:large subunit ribosomal protein L15